VRSKNATAIASPSTLAVDPTRKRFPENEEGPIHPMYAFLYGTDSEEGFIVIGPVGTLLDGEARNNFIKRALAFNPDGKLKGANNVTIAGTYAYVTTDHGLYVIDINDPTNPKLTGQVGEPHLHHPHAVAIQFRYAFVVDEHGLKVLDVTDIASPKPVEHAEVKLEEAHNLYVARTYAYVAAGKQGLAIIDVTEPEHPKLDQLFDAHGEMKEVHDVKTGITANSLYAYVADGEHGLRVVQLIGPDENDDVYGWSPRPKPKLIATYHTSGHALAISKGLDRDRAVDESGNQLAVFGRRGARPFNKMETEKMYMRNGQTYTVTDAPPGPPRDFKAPNQKASVELNDDDYLKAKDRIASNDDGETNDSHGSSLPLVSFALIFLPLAIMLSRQRRKR
jgi:hypothetical protein